MPTYLGIPAGSAASFMGVTIKTELTSENIEQVGGALMVSGNITAQYPGGGDVHFSHSLGEEVVVQTYASSSAQPVILGFTRHSDKITFHFPASLYQQVFKVVIIG